MPWSRAVVRTEEPSKQADSNTMVVVSSIIPLYSPPITPAIATGFLPVSYTHLCKYCCKHINREFQKSNLL